MGFFDGKGVNLFGFQIQRFNQQQPITPITASNDDGAIIVEAPSAGVYVDLDSSYRSELDLIHKYRQMALQPEMENAINDIVDEAIVHDTDSGQIVKMNLDRLQVTPQIKQLLQEEFGNTIKLLDFNNFGDEVFRKWYIDGRLYYNIVIDPANPRAGIQTLVFIDSRKIKKVREVLKEKGDNGQDVVVGTDEYYVYNDKLLMTNPNSGNPLFQTSVANGIRLSKDSVIQVTSGIYDPIKGTILSYLHKAIRPLNQLRFVEDATVIYRVSRAPERRVFYVDVGNMNKQKAEAYLKDMMTKYRNKLTYDSSTGEVLDDRRHLAMLEDFWMPRFSSGRSSEIETLPAGQNLGEMDDVMYFRKALYRALGIPESRIEQPQGIFGVGRPGEITRDEIKYDKFVHRLRAKFSMLFDEVMGRQLALKGICSIEEWQVFKQDIFYVYGEDNNFSELKDNEMLNIRLNTLNVINPFMGVFFSKEWIWKNVLRLDDDEIAEMQMQMQQEKINAMTSQDPTLAGHPWPETLIPGIPPEVMAPDMAGPAPSGGGQ